MSNAPTTQTQQISEPEIATRHGKRAEGMTLVSIPMSRALKADLKKLAKADNRALATWVRIHLSALARRSRAARVTKL
jgi:hypothetical protein